MALIKFVVSFLIPPLLSVAAAFILYLTALCYPGFYDFYNRQLYGTVFELVLLPPLLLVSGFVGALPALFFVPADVGRWQFTKKWTIGWTVVMWLGAIGAYLDWKFHLLP